MNVVYTAILGESDTLKPAPREADRCVCFTDQTDHVSRLGWELSPWDVKRSARFDAWMLRCVSHRLFPEADLVVWADASFAFLDLPRLVRDVGDAECAGMRHPERTSCYDEADELIAIGQSAREPVEQQMQDYRSEGFAPTALTISGLLVRRQTPRVTAFNRLWESEMRRHAGDNTQLSLDYCAWKVGLPIHYLEGVYTDNPYVRYDHEDHQRRRMTYR